MDGNLLEFSYTSSNKKEIFISSRRGRISELLKYCNKIIFFSILIGITFLIYATTFLYFHIFIMIFYTRSIQRDS